MAYNVSKTISECCKAIVAGYLEKVMNYLKNPEQYIILEPLDLKRMDGLFTKTVFELSSWLKWAPVASLLMVLFLRSDL